MAQSPPNRWMAPLVLLLLGIALAASTASGNWGGHTPLLWFGLVAAMGLRYRDCPWAGVVFLPASVLFLLWFAGAATGIVLPFVVGLLVAYLLDPIVDRLEGKMSRTKAITLIALPGVGLLAVFAIFVLPGFLGELAQLVQRLPELRVPLERLQEWAAARAEGFGITVSWASIGEIMLPRIETLGSRLVDAGWGLWKGVQGVIDLISFLVITPVVSFYLLRDFDALRDRLLETMPAASRPQTEAFLGRVDHAVSGYLRGQFLVGLLLGVLFAIGMQLLGQDYALVVGISAVVLNMIPFVGSFLTACIALSVALLGDPGWTSVLSVAALYAGIQLLDAAVVSPRVMGDSLELHPVLVMLALLAAGQFFGLIGVLVAVPATAVLKESLLAWAPQFVELVQARRGPEEST